VTGTLGDAAGPSTTMVKADLRRLVLERVTTAACQFATRTFVVDVRTPPIPGGGEVQLKDREKSTERWAWDEKLTLEFNDTRLCVCAVDVNLADDVPTVYLLGDSTVCDQPREPHASWGQMLPRFSGPSMAVANHAAAGESLRSSLAARRPRLLPLCPGHPRPDCTSDERHRPHRFLPGNAFTSVPPSRPTTAPHTLFRHPTAITAGRQPLKKKHTQENPSRCEPIPAQSF
jgi:hypothetical protein